MTKIREKDSEQPPSPRNDRAEKINSDKKLNKKDDTVWIMTVLSLTLVLSFSISFVIEIIYMAIVVTVWKVIIAVVMLLLIIFVAIMSDMIGVAVTSCDDQPFLAMAARKIYGAKRAVNLCRHSAKVSSILNDIVGDVCGIISGASGATISAVLTVNYLPNATEIGVIIISVVTSAIIAAITITGKAICKRSAVNNSVKITFALAKFLSVFDVKSK